MTKLKQERYLKFRGTVQADILKEDRYKIPVFSTEFPYD
jgi:hypothetical protein